MIDDRNLIQKLNDKFQSKVNTDSIINGLEIQKKNL